MSGRYIRGGQRLLSHGAPGLGGPNLGSSTHRNFSGSYVETRSLTGCFHSFCVVVDPTVGTQRMRRPRGFDRRMWSNRRVQPYYRVERISLSSRS
jgi:hypothetical protein